MRTVFMLAVAIAFAAVPPPASAAGGAEYRFDIWTVDSGLPHNSVNAIWQTRDGYLWLATPDGLVRFDGARFMNFSKANTLGLTSNRFCVLYEDPEGALWAGRDDRGVVRVKDGAFTDFGTASGLPDAMVLAVDVDPDGSPIVYSRGMYRFDGGQFAPYTAEGAPERFDPDRGQTGGFSTWTDEALLDFRAGRYRRVEAIPAADQIVSLHRDQYDVTWAFAGDGRLFRVTAGGVDVLRPGRLPEGRIAAVCGSRAGDVWIAAGPALCRWDGAALTTFTAEDGLPKAQIQELYEDREGLVWVGTTAGLVRASRRAVRVIGERDGLATPNVYAVLEDREGGLWAGTWGGGLFHLRDGRARMLTQEDGLASPLVTALCEDREGRIWVGTQNGGVSVLGGASRAWLSTHTGLPAADVSAIAQDRSGAVWVGTSAGLARVENMRVTGVYTTADGLADEWVSVLREDSRGRLWCGTQRGLCVIEGGRARAVGAELGLSGEWIREVHEDADGTIWVGTYDGGIVRIAGDRITRLTVRDGLFDNGAFRILEDSAGNFWMSSNRGIYRVRRSELDAYAEGRAAAITCVAYNRNDGMATVECNGGRQPAGWRARDGRLIFPTQAGLAVIDPRALPANPIPPPVVIEEALVDNVARPARDAVTLEPGQAVLEIRYTGLSFVKPEGVRFKYRLEGVDAGWVDVGTRRSAYYSHLAPGEYTFTVLAANSDGVWGEAGTSVRVVVLAPIWRTWWFIPSALAALAALVLAAHRRRVAALQRRHAEQEALSRRLIESQEVERKRIAGELHDSLGQSLIVIKNRALLGLTAVDGREEVADQMEAISAAASQAIAEVRSIAYGLHPYQLDRLGLTKAIESVVKTAAASSEVAFAYDIDSIDDALDKGAMINLYRIVQEGVNNVMKHSGATEALVTVKNDAGAVRVTIRDDGRGFARPEGDDPNRRGLGLAGMAERAKMIGAELEIVSAPGRGTEVRVTLDPRGRR